MNKSRHFGSGSNSRPLRLGFVPLCDCAPLVMAQELGLFEKHGLKVHLSREVGWATVRDKIIYGQLDAAHALAPMVLAASLGLGSVSVDCLTGLVLSLAGNAIILSQQLHEACEGKKLKDLARKRGQPLVLGIPFLFSSHHSLLRTWLRSQGLTSGAEVRLVVVPPPQMPANLKAEHLDGYCVGAPWDSVARLGGFGRHAAFSSELAPQHPEKVLMVRREFAESHAGEHERLIAALFEACLFCAVPGNRERIVETLGEPRYVNAPARALREGCESAHGHANAADHEPTIERAGWVLNSLNESGLLPAGSPLPYARVISSFRADIFQNATRTNLQHAHQAI